MTPEEAELEADVFLSVIKGKQFEMPVYFDLEEKKQFDLGKEQVSAIMRAFLKRVESAGYFVGLYGSASSLTTHTADDIKSWYTIWLAHWVDQTNYSGAYGIWQYSEKGKVAGISGNVDLDICYKDFPTTIKSKGLNGFGKAPAPAEEKSEDKRDEKVSERSTAAVPFSQLKSSVPAAVGSSALKFGTAQASIREPSGSATTSFQMG